MQDKPIAVYSVTGSYMSHCSRKRAAQMVHRQKARWIGRDQLELLITNQQEKEIRRRVLQRDGHICYICDTDLSSHEVTYDHIIPRKDGGTDFEDNLAVCCVSCNGDKADRDPYQYTLYLYFKALLLLGGYTYET